MTAKFDKFKEALIALCEEHDVNLSAYCAEVVVLDREETTHSKDLQVEYNLADETTEPAISEAHFPPTQPPHQIT